MSRPVEIRVTKDGVEGYVLQSSLDAWTRNGWTVPDDEEVVTPSDPAQPSADVNPVNAEGEDQ